MRGALCRPGDGARFRPTLPCAYIFAEERIVRTNIVIDDRLMDDALRLTGFKTKKQAVEAGLKMLVRLARQEEIRKLRGQIAWQGDLDEMRSDA